jgi:hypothetical protein
VGQRVGGELVHRSMMTGRDSGYHKHPTRTGDGSTSQHLVKVYGHIQCPKNSCHPVFSPRQVPSPRHPSLRVPKQTDITSWVVPFP